MENIRTPDGRLHLFDNDDHFLEIVRIYCGEHAADWYRERIMRVDRKVREIEKLSAPLKEAIVKTLPSGTKIYDFKKLENLSEDTLLDIVEVAMEIPGWNE